MSRPRHIEIAELIAEVALGASKSLIGKEAAIDVIAGALIAHNASAIGYLTAAANRYPVFREQIGPLIEQHRKLEIARASLINNICVSDEHPAQRELNGEGK